MVNNHLKSQESQTKAIAMACGKHVVAGHPIWSYVIGATPDRQTVVRQVFGEGEWNRIIAAYYRKLNILLDDMVFSSGKQTENPVYKTFTADTSTDEITCNAHGYNNDQEIVFSGNLPSPLEEETVYFVINKTTNTFQVSATQAGTAIDLTSTGSGTIEVYANVGYSKLFPRDIPHSGTVILDYKTPAQIDFAASAKESPSELECIVETENFWDYDANGNQIADSFVYTTNGARVFAGWYLRKGGKKSRINWTAWQAWRDWIGTNETVDYSTITDFVGFGISARFYNGTNFQTFISERIEPFLDFNLGSGSPAVGVDLDSFSIRCEGKLKAKYTETYTFTVEHDNGVRFWLNGNLLIDQWQDDGQHPAGTHTCTFAMTAEQFYDLKIEYNECGGPGYLKMEWQSPSQKREIIPPEVMYAKPQSRPRYETHLAFSETTDLDTAIKAICLVNNSLFQDVDGKLSFYCYEQLTATFAISAATEDTINISDRIIKDVRIPQRFVKKTDTKLRWEADFRDTDSQYLEPAKSVSPLFVEISGVEGVHQTEFVALPNMSRWQARKILLHLIKKRVLNTGYFEIDCDARTYPIVAGDIGTIWNDEMGWNDKLFLVTQSRDKSPEQTADDRTFVIQEWS
jgi:PA14 domain